MPNGYSNDLRDRVLSYYDDGHTQKESCDVFGIGRTTLTSWLKQRRDTGSAHLRPRPKRRRSARIDEQQLRDYLETHPDAYLREIAIVFEVSDVAVLYACRRFGISRKKR